MERGSSWCLMGLVGTVVVGVPLLVVHLSATTSTRSSTSTGAHPSKGYLYQRNLEPEYHDAGGNGGGGDGDGGVFNSSGLGAGTRGYSVPNCQCVRFGKQVSSPPEMHSTCSDFATQRGPRQRVVSYSYYSPYDHTDTATEHYRKYLGQLHGRARSVTALYPGWVMRVYHNVSLADLTATKFLCKLFCTHPHLDLCPVTRLPRLGDLVARGVVGRLWRFAVMGDPTVRTFLVRDSDSWVTAREVAAVRDWLSSEMDYHVMRDHPNHKAVMLAGLWGGHNRRGALLASLRDAMFDLPTNLTRKFDQYLLATRVWPLIKNTTMQHDSYNCEMESHRGSRPFPSQRSQFLYCGWGPFKYNERRVVFQTKCPVACRPPLNLTWTHC